MGKLSKIVKSILLSLVILALSPYILYGVVMSAWGAQHNIEKFFKNQAIHRATSVIEPFHMGDQTYDITTAVLGIANTEVEYSQDGARFSIDRMEYRMDSSVFHHYCTIQLQSYNREDNDVELINKICQIINRYDLDYEYIESYGYRGFFYGDCYVYGRYDEAYLNGQYFEIALHPIEGKKTILRFDLELPPDSLEYQMICDLRAMEFAVDEGAVNSIENILGLISVAEKQPQVLLIS